MCSIRNKIYG